MQVDGMYRVFVFGIRGWRLLSSLWVQGCMGLGLRECKYVGAFLKMFMYWGVIGIIVI